MHEPSCRVLLAESAPIEALEPAASSFGSAALCLRFRRLRSDVSPHKLERPVREEAVHETYAHHRHALRRSRGTAGG
jgi:hypothetical protein